MIISNQKDALNIKIRESILTKVSTVKFIGARLDENLTFKDLVNKVTSSEVCWCHEKTPLPVACKRNVYTVLFYGVFSSDLCCTGMGKIWKY